MKQGEMNEHVDSFTADSRSGEHALEFLPVSISCRLLKDHRKVIHLAALCHPPQLAVSHTELSFSMPRLDAAALHKGRGLLQPSAPSLRVEPKGGLTVTIANLGGTPLRYAVRSSCCFFHVALASPLNPSHSGTSLGRMPSR